MDADGSVLGQAYPPPPEKTKTLSYRLVPRGNKNVTEVTRLFVPGGRGNSVELTNFPFCCYVLFFVKGTSFKLLEKQFFLKNGAICQNRYVNYWKKDA